MGWLRAPVSRIGQDGRRRPQAPGLVREGGFLTFLTVIGKLSGIVREILIARLLGAGVVADAWRIAQEFSMLFWNILSGGQVEMSLVPMLTRWRTAGRHQLLSLLFRVIAWMLFAISLVTMILTWLFAPEIVTLQAPSYTSGQADVVVMMIRWIAPSIPLFVAINLLGYLLASVHRFRIFTLMSLILNTGLIGGTLAIGYAHASPAWLCIGYNLALSVTLLLLFVDARQWWPWKVRSTFGRIRTILQPFLVQYWPLLGLIALYQVRMFIDKRIVSDFAIGAIAALGYARYIIETPFSTAGMALIRLVLPRFSEMVERRETEKIGTQYLAMLEISLWAILPWIMILAASAEPVVRILYFRGAFDERALGLTSLAVIGAAPVLWTRLILPLISRIFNAQRRNGILFLYGAAGLVLNIILAFSLVDSLGIAGVAFAAGLGELFSILLLSLYLPGNVSWKALGLIFSWWCATGILFIVLRLLPVPDSSILHILATTGYVAVSWSLLTILLPSGRRAVKQLYSAIVRLKRNEWMRQ